MKPHKRQKPKRLSQTQPQHPNLDLEHLGDIDSYIGYWLRFVSNQVTSSFQERLSKKGATVAEWIVLRFLISHAPCSLTTLSEEMGMDKGALSRLTDRLEKRDLIVRTFSTADRRLSSIELTSKGKKLVPSLAKIAQENDVYFFSHLSKNRITILLSLLKGIAARHGIEGRPLD